MLGWLWTGNQKLVNFFFMAIVNQNGSNDFFKFLGTPKTPFRVIFGKHVLSKICSPVDLIILESHPDKTIDI